jgi:hypothetical protein
VTAGARIADLAAVAAPGLDVGSARDLHAPAGRGPAGQAPTGTGQAPTGQAPTGQAPTGQAPTGQAQAGEAQAGTAQAGTAQAGEAQAGEAQAGTAPRVWTARVADDPIRFTPFVRIAGLGHGADPTGPGFGARLFRTGTAHGHGGYFVPGTESLTNLARIALGRTAEVTVNG